MSILRWGPFAAGVVFALPAMAQIPPGPDLACWCLKQAVDDTHTDMATKQGALSAVQAQLAQLDSQLAQARATEDVSNPQSVAQFRQLLAQRDAMFKQTNGDIVAAVQAATARYNQAVADYNNGCAGRPLPPPPPGPLVCR
jgi:capsule polysaccharide export protein KpsE/RkpR